MDDVSTSEEGERMAVFVSQGKEAETVVRGMTTVGDDISTCLSALKLVSELTDEMVAGLGTISKVRTVVKRGRASQNTGGRCRPSSARLYEIVTKCHVKLPNLSKCNVIVDRNKSAMYNLYWRHDDRNKGAVTTYPKENLHDAVTTTNAGEDKIVNKGAAAGDGLSTAMMTVVAYQREVKFESDARYCVAGTDWMMRGECARKDVPVHCVEGIGGVLLDVIGVWTFSTRNVYGQSVQVDACIMDGFTSEVRVDFLEKYRATVDFDSGEVRYVERGHAVFIPFRADGIKNDTTATVRLSSATNLQFRTMQPVEVAVAAADGDEGIFLPTVEHGAVLLAAAVTKFKDGKRWYRRSTRTVEASSSLVGRS
ncbi:hypothetical protein PHMEG_0006333 [Phytophthora megakarya]|uniref:Uncharacterized protein n=1 Tax=Phytophthora megakarya TaxID=4795 RepID=A0A225WP94_9STRA|nr:hypothetical protein PHMEG_0006333 [Phytophthora megakarya]